MRSNPAGREAFEYVPSMFAAPGRELTEGVHIPVRMYAVAWREIACAGGCDVWVLDTSRSPPLVPGGQAQGGADHDTPVDVPRPRSTLVSGCWFPSDHPEAWNQHLAVYTPAVTRALDPL